MVARIQLPASAARGEVIDVRIAIQHPMETGFRQDEQGRTIPRNCINALTCRYNGAEVFRADLSSGISANPYLQFYAVAAASGDFVFSWIDDEQKEGTERARLVVRE
jgi:sulfur-oxidizing protein SoxZ